MIQLFMHITGERLPYGSVSQVLFAIRPQTNLSRSESFKIIIIPEQEGYHPILFYLQFYVAFRFYGVPYMYPM